MQREPLTLAGPSQCGGRPQGAGRGVIIAELQTWKRWNAATANCNCQCRIGAEAMTERGELTLARACPPGQRRVVNGIGLGLNPFGLKLTTSQF